VLGEVVDTFLCLEVPERKLAVCGSDENLVVEGVRVLEY